MLVPAHFASLIGQYVPGCEIPDDHDKEAQADETGEGTYQQCPDWLHCMIVKPPVGEFFSLPYWSASVNYCIHGLNTNRSAL